MTFEGELNDRQALKQQTKPACWGFPDIISPTKEEAIETELIYDDACATGTGKEIILEGIYVWYGKFQVHSESPIVVRPADSYIQMLFNLESVTSYSSELSSKPFVKFKPQQHNLLVLPKKNMLVQWKAQQEAEVISINLSNDFFFGNLPVSHPIYGHFQKGISSLMPAFMSWRNLPVTSKMISALFEIVHCSYSGYHKSLFIKAKVTELLALQFEQYENLPVPDIASSLKESDKEKMHLARNIIIENLDKTWSLKDLAHQVGTNEFNLKKYFKEVFGKPVFAYLHDLRMETSVQMLQQPGSKIGEISQKTGYKNPTHFTAAFKKYYGILPNKIRIGLLNLLHLSDYAVQLLTQFIEDTSAAGAL